MQLTPVLIWVTLMAVADATMLPKMSKPKLNLVNSQNNHSDITAEKLPAERRRHSLFPRNLKKFVVTSIPPYQTMAEKPIINVTRKPLMKKMVLQNNVFNTKNVIMEHTTKVMNKNHLLVSTNKATVTKENKENVIKENLPEEAEEEIQTHIYPLNELEDVKMEVNEDKLRQNQLLQPNNVIDSGEYIFFKPLIQMEKEEADVEEFGESITTENPLEPIQSKVKRSNNIIEEENLGTTVSGYKFTWRDTRLTNDLIFKNIHS